MLSVPLASRALATTLAMSSGARNWPFLIFTGLPADATARMKSVCRHRNAGVCNTSTTAATSAISSLWCTSVRTGTPTCRLTSARMRSPSAIPSPRNDFNELRLALSYDDLKMSGIFSRAQISFRRPATSICNCSDSTTHGPAMRNRGRCNPTSKPQRFMRSGDELRARSYRIGDRDSPALECRVDECDKQRMAAAWIRSEFGMELAAEEPGMARELDHLAQISGGGALGPGANREPGRLEARQVMIVDFIAMPVSLGNGRRAIDPVRKRSGHHLAGLGAETHSSSEIGAMVPALDRAVAILPLGDQCHYRVRRRGIELGAVRVGETSLVPRILDDRQLHPQTDAEIGNAVLARMANRLDLAFDAALAKSTRHYDRVHSLEAVDTIAFHGFGIEVMNGDLAAGVNAGVGQRFRQ